MWRVILRISYTSDVGSGLRNNVVPIFQALVASFVPCRANPQAVTTMFHQETISRSRYELRMLL